MVRRRGLIRGVGNVRPPSSSDAPGVVGTSSLDSEAERVGEPGDSSRNMRRASSIENV